MSYSIYYCNKPIGITPTECCQKLRIILNLTDKQKIGFACRLDPLAYGLMPVIIHDTSVKRIQDVYSTFNGMDKTYTFKVILGYTTDTYDILGIPVQNTYDCIDISKTLSDIINL